MRSIRAGCRLLTRSRRQLGLSQIARSLATQSKWLRRQTNVNVRYQKGKDWSQGVRYFSSCSQEEKLPRTLCASLEVPAERSTSDQVRLAGWLQQVRTVGSGLCFGVLRDHSGTVQIVADAESSLEGNLAQCLQRCPAESVLEIVGTVRTRPSDMQHNGQRNGLIEVVVQDIHVLNEADARLPFPVHKKIFLGDGDVKGRKAKAAQVARTTAQRHRYLQLRRPVYQDLLRIRSRLHGVVVSNLQGAGFTYVDTPYLFKSTPEGSREFLVPANLYRDATASPGSNEESKGVLCYALPQSPQQYKQLLMIGGLDKYFQVARCFRDETNHPDRQQEFTQIDMECSFVTGSDIRAHASGLVHELFQTVNGLYWGNELQHIQHTQPHSDENAGPHIVTPSGLDMITLNYATVMDAYGVDKPDLRNPLRLIDVTEEVMPSPSSGGPLCPLAEQVAAHNRLWGVEPEDATHCNESKEARRTQGSVKALYLPRLRQVTGLSKKKLRALLEAEASPDGNAKLVIVPLEGKEGGKLTWKLAGKRLNSESMLREESVQDAVTSRLRHRGIVGTSAEYPSGVRHPVVSDDLHDGDYIILTAGNWEAVCDRLGRIRQRIGRRFYAGRKISATAESSACTDGILDLRDISVFYDSQALIPMWVTEFPLLEFQIDKGRPNDSSGDWEVRIPEIEASHHPFTLPQSADAFDILRRTCPIDHKDHKKWFDGEDALKLAGLRSTHFDLVMNGQEVGGGSMRIPKRQDQELFLRLLGADLRSFRHLLDGLGYGAPPHGGMALGFDRLCALLADPFVTKIAPEGSPPDVTPPLIVCDALDHGEVEELEDVVDQNARVSVGMTDVIAFPKSMGGIDHMVDAPSWVAWEDMDRKP